MSAPAPDVSPLTPEQAATVLHGIAGTGEGYKPAELRVLLVRACLTILRDAPKK